MTEPTDAELRVLLEAMLATLAKRNSSRRERVEKDPKAYFTRRVDFERAEQAGQDTSEIPRLNCCG